MGRLVFIISFLLTATALRAEQHAACDKPNLQDLDRSAKRLHAIAETCERPEISRLFYKRAYMRELLDQYEQLNETISTNDESQASYETYRILIGLVEAFAGGALSGGDTRMLSRLSRTYDHYIEIAELRLKGYDLIANRMEREMQL